MVENWQRLAGNLAVMAAIDLYAVSIAGMMRAL